MRLSKEDTETLMTLADNLSIAANGTAELHTLASITKDVLFVALNINDDLLRKDVGSALYSLAEAMRHVVNTTERKQCAYGAFNALRNTLNFRGFKPAES